MGAWTAVHETGWTPDLIVGTSVGALNGAMIASGQSIEWMHGWWQRLGQKDLLRKRNVLKARHWLSFFDAAPMRRLLEAHLDVQALRSGIPLKITAVCVETGTEVIWDSPELDVNRFMATTALMPGMPPVAIDGRHYADGGHWGALPLRHALEAGATDVHVLLHDPIEPHAASAPRSIRGALRRQSDIIWHGRQAAEWEALQARMDLPKRHAMHLAKARIQWHAPSPPLENEILKFEPKISAALLQRGYDETVRRLGPAN
jgi:predicted acylesterase/phospholipase RssA